MTEVFGQLWFGKMKPDVIRANTNTMAAIWLMHPGIREKKKFNNADLVIDDSLESGAVIFINSIDPENARFNRSVSFIVEHRILRVLTPKGLTSRCTCGTRQKHGHGYRGVKNATFWKKMHYAKYRVEEPTAA